MKIKTVVSLTPREIEAFKVTAEAINALSSDELEVVADNKGFDPDEFNVCEIGYLLRELIKDCVIEK